MTLENLKKHHAHLKWLASGDFTERDFDYKIKPSDNPDGKKGDGGHCEICDEIKDYQIANEKVEEDKSKGGK